MTRPGGQISPPSPQPSPSEGRGGLISLTLALALALGLLWSPAEAQIPDAQDLEAQDLEARALEEQGTSLFFQARSQEAVDVFEAALEIHQRLDDRQAIARVHKSLGVALREVGRYEESLDHLETARWMATELEHWSLLGSVLGNLASVYSRLESVHLAEATCRQLLDLANDHDLGNLALDAHARLGQIYLDAGSPTRALVELEAALEQTEAGGSQGGTPEERVWILEMIGDAAQMHGDVHRACEIFRSTLAHHVAEGPTFRRVGSLIGLGTCLEEVEPALAMETFRQAEHWSEGRSWAADAGLGRLHRASGDLSDAIVGFERALVNIKAQRRDAPSLASRQTLWRSTRGVYNRLIESLWDRDQGEDRLRALKIVERARAEGRSERWWQSRTHGKESPENLDLEKNLADANRALAQADLAADERTRLEQRLSRLEVELRAGQESQWQSLADPPPFSLATLQEHLPERTHLLLFHLSDERGFAFLIGPRDFHTVELDARPENLALLIENLLDLVQRNHPAWRRPARRLFDRLVAPWWPRVEVSEQLIVALDGPLTSLPLEALAITEGSVGAGELVLEHIAVHYTLSAAMALEQLRASTSAPPAPEARLLLVAQSLTDPALTDPALTDPALTTPDIRPNRRRAATLLLGEGFDLRPIPAAVREVRRVNALTGGGAEVLIESDASEESVRQALASGRINKSRPGVLHFATHAVLSRRQPSRSALVLSTSGDGDGMLQAGEIQRLKIPAELVVLSACRTARGGTLNGGMHHLAEAFFFAGAQSVLGSLWDVDDTETALFMGDFYRHLAQGVSKGEALRRTKLSRARVASPNHWLPFVLIGDATRPVHLPPPTWSSKLRSNPGWFSILFGGALCLLWILFRTSSRPQGQAHGPSPKT